MNGFGKRRKLIALLTAALLLMCVPAISESTSEEPDEIYSPESVSIRELGDISEDPSPEAETEDHEQETKLPAEKAEDDEEDDNNLLYNGRFELIDEDGLPESWYTDEYYRESGYTVFSVPEDEASGRGRVVEIWNRDGNDARFLQYVPVEPNTVYCLSGYIWAEGISGGHGANFSIEDVYSFSEEIYDTNGEWKYVEYYGQTGPKQDILTVFVRVGGYGGESAGKARFDNMRLTEVTVYPVGVDIAYWYTANRSYDDSGNSDDYEDTSFRYAQNDTEENSRLFLILTGTGWTALFLLFAAYFKGRKRAQLIHSRAEKYYFVPILLCAFAVRLVISYYVEGYMVDVNCFNSWGGTMDAYGPLKFYQKTSYCDYPPLYTYKYTTVIR